MPRDPEIPTRFALDLFGEQPEMLRLAKIVTDVSGWPMVGGIAVFLHGYARTTQNFDIYTSDTLATHEKLIAASIRFDARHKEHVIQGVAIHMVGDDSLGGPPKRTSTIRGVKVVGLADLVRGKLTVGTTSMNRAKDIADVIEPVRALPLKKDSAPKLPKHLRPAFKVLVEQVHEPRRTPIPTLQFWKKYA